MQVLAWSGAIASANVPTRGFGLSGRSQLIPTTGLGLARLLLPIVQQRPLFPFQRGRFLVIALEDRDLLVSFEDRALEIPLDGAFRPLTCAVDSGDFGDDFDGDFS